MNVSIIGLTLLFRTIINFNTDVVRNNLTREEVMRTAPVRDKTFTTKFMSLAICKDLTLNIEVQ